MTPKETLTRIKELDDAAKAAMAQLESLEADATRITPRYGTEPVMGGDTGDGMNAVVRLIEARRRCNDMIDAYVNHKAFCLDIINLIENGKYREVLTLRYIHYLSFDDIADRMNYTVRQITRLNGYALLEFGRLLK